MAKLEIAVLIGEESKKFLVQLADVVGRLEELQRLETKVAQVTKTPPAEKTNGAAKPAPTKKVAKPKVEEESFELDDENTEDAEVEASADQDAEVTKDDLIKAFSVSDETREQAITILKGLPEKYFELSKEKPRRSIHTLRPKHYSSVLAQLEA